MRKNICPNGRTVIPEELLDRDDIRPGGEFDVLRLENVESALRSRYASVNDDIVDWLLGCPVKVYFVPIVSESTDALCSSLLRSRSSFISRSYAQTEKS